MILTLLFAAAFTLRPDSVRGQGSTHDSSAAVGSGSDSAAVVVTCYRATIRCAGCLTIERFAEASMRYLFGRELAEGKIVWRVINFEKEEGDVSAGRYAIENHALIVSQYRSGREIRWKRLGKVWDLLGDYRAFQEYVGGNVREYL